MVVKYIGVVGKQLVTISMCKKHGNELNIDGKDIFSASESGLKDFRQSDRRHFLSTYSIN